MSRVESIICVIEQSNASPARKRWISQRVAAVDPGHDARLVVRSAEGRIWVTYIGGTDPRSVGGLVDLLRTEIRAACEVDQ